MKDTVKWRVLFGGFFSYTFDAMDILLLAMCLQAIMADLHLTPAAAGLLATPPLATVVALWCVGTWLASAVVTAVTAIAPAIVIVVTLRRRRCPRSRKATPLDAAWSFGRTCLGEGLMRLVLRACLKARYEER